MNLKRKIGDDIYMYFGSLIPYEKLEKIGDIKQITEYLKINNIFFRSTIK